MNYDIYVYFLGPVLSHKATVIAQWFAHYGTIAYIQKVKDWHDYLFCKYMNQFSIRYKDQPLDISGEANSYALRCPGKETITIEKMPDGWYKVNDLELYWTDHDVAAIGALIEIENPSGFHGIPFN